MNFIEKYYSRIISLVSELYDNEFKKTTPGHCMKITGLRQNELNLLWKDITDKYPHVDTFIISEDGLNKDDKYISATKLIELRNSEERPLLILIPANSRTAAEDSYGNATFKEISLEVVETELYKRLIEAIPVYLKKQIQNILNHPYSHKISNTDKINYLLFLEEKKYDKEEVGDALFFLNLIPDKVLLKDKNKLRSRLNMNMKCTEIMCNFGIPLFDRISELPINKNSIQANIVDFLNENTEIKDRKEIVKLIYDKYKNLNFEHWAIDIIDPDKFELFVDNIISKDFIYDGGIKVLKANDKSKKVTLKIRTVPKPIELDSVKYFRIELYLVDGASGILVNDQIRKMKKTGTNKDYRNVQVELDPNIVEEGTYFFRVVAEDETGSKLNIHDKFKDIKVQQQWEEDINALKKQKLVEEQFEKKKEELLEACYQFKRTCDSEDFDFILDDDIDIEPKLKKDKVKNRLQAYFAFRIEHLRKQEELSMPELQGDSGIWINDSDTKLNSTYYLKYNNNHNYQINIPNKLRKIERLFIENKEEFGQIFIVTRNDAESVDFSSFHFISSDVINKIIPQKLITLRKKVFEAISESAKDNSGIFETFDFYRHIDTIREYISEYTNWTSQLKSKFININRIKEIEKVELHNLLIELQNIDIVNLKLNLPNQTAIDIKLLSPLHPLRLTWYLQLFDLFSDWEEKTVNFAGHIDEWRNLENLFSGDIFPENNPLVIVGAKDDIAFQYATELFYNWGIYIKPVVVEDENTFSSVNRQITTYLRYLLNIGSDNYIDTDISKNLIVKYIKSYITQHPYIDKLIINLFNAGDAVVFANSLVELEKQKELRHLTYEIRLFRGKDNIINHGEGLKELINPEYNITEEAEAFSQQSQNRLFPKLRFSVARISDYIEDASKYIAHISFLINLFPANTRLFKPKRNYSNFYMNGVITDASIEVINTDDEMAWDRFIYPNHLNKKINDFSNKGIKLFENFQMFTAGALNNKITDSIPSTKLQLGKKDNVQISLVHDYSDWVVTFDRNIGPQAFDQPSKNGYIPFLLDYIPGEELTGISSFLTTRPNSEILGLLAPHFSEFNLKIINDDEDIASSILLEDLRAISSSLVMQLNSGKNKAFEVIGTAFTKRVLEKKGLLEESFLIPIDLHQHLFNNNESESRSRADNMLVKINTEKRIIEISIIEIKCRKSLTEMEKSDLRVKIAEQINNTINILRYHFSSNYNLSEDRLDREIKNKELKSFLSFYIERATRYNYLEPQVAQLYLNFINTLDIGFEIAFKKFGFIFNFSSPVKHKKEIFDDDIVIYSFGENLISEILNPDSDLNTSRIEDKDFDNEFIQDIGGDIKISDFIKEITKYEKIDEQEQENVEEPIIETTKISKGRTATELNGEKSEVKEETIVDFVTPKFDIFIGKDKPTKQYGILGKSIHGKKIAMDLSETNTISLFGVQGGGKSYSIGTVTEMVLKQFENINSLPSPLAGVIFHYSESMDYEPEFTSMKYPNDSEKELKILIEDYSAKSGALDELVILTPKDKVEERKEQFPDIPVYPIAFNSMELNVQDWLFLLGAIGNDSTYIKQLKYIMKSNRRNLTIQSISDGIENDELLTNTQKALARQRLDFAREYVDDSFSLKNILKPEQLIIVDLRDEFIEKDEALGLFVIMLNIFSSVKVVNGKHFNKFIVFDEAHKYMDNKALTDNIVTSIREMRHKGVSIMIASQDPPSLPNEIIELSSIVITHKFNSPQWLKHIQKSITQLSGLQASDLSALKPGEAFLWSTKASEKTITNKPQKIFTRPRVTKHGGGTIKATD